MKRAACVAGLTLAAWSFSVEARQQPAPAAPAAPPRQALPPPAPKTGNPTPGTPQPDPPNVADRITVTGCLELAAGAGPAPASAATTPASNRFVLKDARKDAAASATIYKLEALESQLSPFVNVRVELSGEVKAPADTTPVLLVEFVRKTAPRCQ